jgi:hypothetical protein
MLVQSFSAASHKQIQDDVPSLRRTNSLANAELWLCVSRCIFVELRSSGLLPVRSERFKQRHSLHAPLLHAYPVLCKKTEDLLTHDINFAQFHASECAMRIRCCARKRRTC